MHHICRPRGGRSQCERVHAMLRARTWKPSDRKYVSKGVCFSDMICPNEDPIFDAVGDLLEKSFRYTRVQLNRYDPKAGDSRMIVMGDYQGGDFLIEDHGPRATPTRIHEKYRWIAFDGRNRHWTTPITSGIRCSIVAFVFAERTG